MFSSSFAYLTIKRIFLFYFLVLLQVACLLPNHRWCHANHILNWWRITRKRTCKNSFIKIMSYCGVRWGILLRTFNNSIQVKKKMYFILIEPEQNPYEIKRHKNYILSTLFDLPALNNIFFFLPNISQFPGYSGLSKW